MQTTSTFQRKFKWNRKFWQFLIHHKRPTYALLNNNKSRPFTFASPHKTFCRRHLDVPQTKCRRQSSNNDLSLNTERAQWEKNWKNSRISVNTKRSLQLIESESIINRIVNGENRWGSERSLANPERPDHLKSAVDHCIIAVVGLI